MTRTQNYTVDPNKLRNVRKHTYTHTFLYAYMTFARNRGIKPRESEAFI